MIVLLTKYKSNDEIKRDAISGACDTFGREEMDVQGFCEEISGKRPHGSSRHRFNNNDKLDLREMGRVDWTQLGCVLFTVIPSCGHSKISLIAVT
jgi:hypothetical protein